MITIDTREKFIERIKEVIIEIENPPEFKIGCLDKGDYDIQNDGRQLRIERKNINDFCGSFRVLKGRLHDMRLQNEYTALLLEGTYSVQSGLVWVQEGCHLQPRMDYKTFSNFLTHQASLGTWLFHTMCLEESIYRMINIHDYLPRLNAPNAIKCGTPIEWFMMLPGVGKTKISELRNDYSTPWDALNGLPKRAKDTLMKW